MPKRLRRAVNRLTSRGKGRTRNTMQPSDRQGPNAHPHASFLGLPAEIRNQIYEELALDTSLHLWPTKERKSPPPVGLLLACRQTQQEYRAVLFSNASVLITIAEYNFSNLVRVLEKLPERDVDCLKLNNQVWILLLIGHVPTRDDHKNLRGWVDYRGSRSNQPYFGPGRAAAQDLIFEYDVRFLNQIRPPKPISRYANGYQMKLDLLRSHLRMYNRLQSGDEDDNPNEELNQLRSNIGHCIEIFEELHIQRYEQAARSMSVSTTQTTQSIPASLVSNSTASTANTAVG